jgi:hypothetical protein
MTNEHRRSAVAIDIVKPAPKTELEAWNRWLNRMETQLRTLPYYDKVKIEVKAL